MYFLSLKMLHEIFYYDKMYMNKLDTLELLTKKKDLEIRKQKKQKVI